MKQLRNPTDTDVRITIKGEDYVSPANGVSVPVSDEVAATWVGTHQFLSVENAVAEEPKPKVEEAEKPSEPKVEEPKEARKSRKKASKN